MLQKDTKAKEPVKIRLKKLANGNKSIYLDIYHNGKRSYEFLKLYLIPQTSRETKQRNENTMHVATVIKSQRILDITNDKAGITLTHKNNILLLDWIKQCREEQEQNGKRGIKTYTNTINVLRAYKGNNVKLNDIDTKYCMGLYRYLLITPTAKTGKPLAKSSIELYCNCLNISLNRAVTVKLISENPFKNIPTSDKVKANESIREYLTIDEIKKMANAPCKHNAVKSAYMFACFCGLRLSDIERLTWDNVVEDNGQYRIETIMQKTQTPIYLPLSDEATSWLPNRNEMDNHSHRIFPLPCRVSILNILKDWASKAGIPKNISFHTSRHTFATTMLTLGADLYTTSKLLGHTDVGTTQIYAKIIDQKKTEAINLMNGILK